MSFASDVSGGNAYDIGDLLLSPENGERFVRKGRTFSRCGSAIPASGFPRAAVNQRTMINGLASSGLPATSYIKSWASDGAGKFVFVTDARNTYYSLDNGQTLAITSAGNPADTVVYNASVGKFITFYNDANNVLTSSATNPGGAWSSGGSLTPGNTMIAGTIRAVCDGTNVVAAWQSNSAAAASALTTTDATTLTSRSFGASTDTSTKPPFLSVLPSLGTSRWVVMYGVTSYVSTNSSGSSWSGANTSPQGAAGNIVGLASGNGKTIACGRIAYSISIDNLTWTTYAYPSVVSSSTPAFDGFAPGANSNTCANWLNFDGSHFVTGTATYADFANAVQGKFGFTADGLSWTMRQITYPCYAAALSQRQQVSANGYLISFQTGVGGATGHIPVAYSANWKTSANYVGIARPLLPPIPSNSSLAAYYVSIS